MSARDLPADPARLQRLQQEILRWNTQINLVTRVDTERQVGTLTDHCLEAWRLLVGQCGHAAWFPSAAYLDLGSGAGFPGLVWALARRSAGHAGTVTLVEPRAKRAWFLRRTARLLGLENVAVAEGRWGEVVLPAPGAGSEAALLSLKALRLTDAEVLRGLRVARGDAALPGKVLVVRFQAPLAPAPVGYGAGPAAGDGGDVAPYVLGEVTLVGDVAPRLGFSWFDRAGG